MRNFKINNEEYYHIYNRGVDKRNIFLDKQDYERFLKSIKEFNNFLSHGQRVYLKNRKKMIKSEFNSEASELNSGILCSEKLVEVICYCLNPNHFHLILKQLVDKGIEKFMQKLSTGYTNYFNIKYKRTGSLFQGRYKASKVNTDEQLIWLSVYVNCNAQIHNIVNKSENYRWCGYPEYIGLSNNKICNNDVVSDQFKDSKDYQNFSSEVVPAIKEQKNLEKLFIEK